MDPGISSMAQQSWNQSQALQNFYNQQANQRTDEYNQSYNNAQNAQGQLQNFTQNMANGNQLYQQNLTNAQNQYGFNPQDLLKANQALAATNTTLANLPKAIQQQGNYYGTTAGSEANNYSQLSGNLNSVEQGQANASNAFQQTLASTLNQANQQTSQAMTGQAQQLQGYQQTAANATAIMQNSAQVMNQIETLQQQQGTVTANQQNTYAAAANNYASARQALAAAAADYAQAGLFGAQAGYWGAETQGALNSMAPQMQQRTGGGFNFMYKGNPISAQTYANLTGQNFQSLLGSMAAQGDSGARQYLNGYGVLSNNSPLVQQLTWGS